MKVNQTRILASAMMALWALVTGLQVGHEWSHHSHGHAHHHSCSVHAPQPESSVQSGLDESANSWTSSEAVCAICDWEFAPQWDDLKVAIVPEGIGMFVPTTLGSTSESLVKNVGRKAHSLRGPPSA